MGFPQKSKGGSLRKCTNVSILLVHAMASGRVQPGCKDTMGLWILSISTSTGGLATSAVCTRTISSWLPGRISFIRNALDLSRFQGKTGRRSTLGRRVAFRGVLSSLNIRRVRCCRPRLARTKLGADAVSTGFCASSPFAGICQPGAGVQLSLDR